MKKHFALIAEETVCPNVVTGGFFLRFSYDLAVILDLFCIVLIL